LLSPFLNDPDFFLRKIVDVVDQAVGGVDLAHQAGLLMVRPGGSQPPVEGERLLEQISNCLFYRRQQS
jgi:hypothetical protein